MTLQTQSFEDLKKQWRSVFKTNPPPFARSTFIQSYLIWEEQKRLYGGPKRTTVKALEKQIAALRNGTKPPDKKTLVLKPGTKLIREHQGQRHEVIVQEKGYRYQDQIYRSLSAIARGITGTQWNGKLFFGVKS